MHWSLDGVYEPDTGTGVWRRPSGGVVDHNDGDAVEERLLSVVRNAGDRTSTSAELAAHINDWPSNYHLSPRRANLLRPIVDLLRGDVLDVGAGCGALTRYLGENSSRVLAIEGSPRRAAIAAERCRDLPAVSVVCDRIEHAQLSASFDAITLIGVLEYASRYNEGADPVRGLLRHFGRMLKPDGCLIIGIENQLGLKYLGGAPEDHLMLPMFGINDLYGDRSVTTFGWKQLRTILAESGLAATELLLPFPDYKLPTTVVLPPGYESDGNFDLAPFLAATASEDPQPTGLPTFSLERAWRVVARNGLACDLANSFLVVVRKSRVSHPLGLSNEGVLLHRYGLPRTTDSAATVFRRTAAGGICVSRSVPPQATSKCQYIRNGLSETVYVPGTVWADELLLVLNRHWWSPDAVAEWARPWYSLLIQVCQDDMLPAGYFDATPMHLIRTAAGGFQFVNPGWAALHPVSLDHLLFRGLWWSLARATSVTRPTDGCSLSRFALIQDTLRRLGHSVKTSWESLVRMEIEFLQKTRVGIEGRLTFEEVKASTLVPR